MSEQIPAAPKTTEAERPKRRLGWLSATVAVLFAIVYAYNVWDAIRNLVELPTFYVASGLSSSSVPWWVLIIALLIPIAVFAAAFWVGLRRNVLSKSLIFIVGFALVQCLTFGTVALEAILRPLG
jgi:hypothetical protein